jgi:hypothetical protein
MACVNRCGRVGMGVGDAIGADEGVFPPFFPPWGITLLECSPSVPKHRFLMLQPEHEDSYRVLGTWVGSPSSLVSLFPGAGAGESGTSPIEGIAPKNIREKQLCLPRFPPNACSLYHFPCRNLASCLSSFLLTRAWERAGSE